MVQTPIEPLGSSNLGPPATHLYFNPLRIFKRAYQVNKFLTTDVIKQ